MNELFLENMKSLLGEDYEKYVKSMDLEPIKSFRINTHKLGILGVNDTSSQTFLEKYIPLAFQQSDINKSLFNIANNIKLGDSILHKAGLIYVQEPSSTMAVFALSTLNDFEGKRVLDMCAAPGGKTSQLAELVGENGFVLSNEFNLKRAQILRGNIERLGYKNVAISSCDTSVIAKEMKHQFDVVLVDAPCSGEGMFRKDKDAIHEWSEGATNQNPIKQLNILENGARCVNSGGYLAYSTCTFNLKENENVVYEFLKNNPQFEICKLSNIVNEVSHDGIMVQNFEPLKHARRFYPFKNFGEGQFICIMKNNGEDAREFIPYKPKFSSKESKQIKTLLKDLFNIEDPSLTQLGNMVFLHGKNIAPIQNLPLLTCGVAVCDLNDKVIKPHHNLFMAFGEKCTNKLNLNYGDERIQKFFKGEQIFADAQDGYCAILVDNMPIGFGKAKNGTINNHYPKGLRI